MVNFSLEIIIHGEDPVPNLPEDGCSTTIVVANEARISATPVHDGVKKPSTPKWLAVFIPSVLTETGFLGNLKSGSISSLLRVPGSRGKELSQHLLAMVHPFLRGKVHLQAICCIRGARHNPADILLIPIVDLEASLVEAVVSETHCETIHTAPESILKVLLLHDLKLCHDGEFSSGSKVASLTPPHFDIPTCPVCLHRIEPFRLGLPKPRNHQLCSKFCNPSSQVSSSVECPRQQLLLPWPEPSHCVACHVVQMYWDEQSREEADLFCHECALEATLWLCLTCGFVGCGVYSNKHAEHHFLESGHPYSMELATLRVWSYADGEFAHRVDLLDCPSSPHLCRPWKRRIPSDVSYEPTNPSEKHPKKATMIGEEYEVLLQSALEDQSQHYEGEISRLQAELTAEQIDSSQLTIDEMREVAMLREEIHQLRSNIEHSGNELLELQSQERGHRETSQRLLREQQVAQDLLKSMREECAKERDHRQRALEELEQQIADLTANQRMMQQFTRDGELANAHIWGTSGTPGRQGKKGKKFRKNGRR